MKKTKENTKGITLIALVITIILLLILAGITISQLTKNGIIEKAKFAAEETKKVQVQEEIQMSVNQIFIDCVAQGKDITNIILKEELEKNNSVEGIIINSDLTGTYKGYEYYIDENYNVHIKGANDKPVVAKIEAKEEKRIINVMITDSKEGIQKIEVVNPSGEIVATKELDGVVTTGELENCIANQSGNYNIKVMLKSGDIEEKIVYVKKIKIGNKAELEEFRDIVNSGVTFQGDIVELIEDIDLQGSESNRNWTSIGGSGTEMYFSGTFEGNDYKIYNIYNIINSEMQGGFFGVIKGGEVKNLGIESGNITMRCSAAIVGNIENGSVINCYNNAKIEIKNAADWAGRIGGIVGLAKSTIIKNCYNSGEIISDNGIYECIGGIAGQISENSQILSCYNEGSINAIDSVGGIVGYTAGNVLVNNCYNKGSITGTSNVGGLIGYNEPSDQITNCYNIGKVTGSKNVGGVIGTHKGVLSNLFFIDTSGPDYGCGINDSDPFHGLEESSGSTEQTVKQLTSKFNEKQTDIPWKEDKENINNGYPILNWQ